MYKSDPTTEITPQEKLRLLSAFEVKLREVLKKRGKLGELTKNSYE